MIEILGEQFLKMSDVCELVSVNRSTVKRWVTEGLDGRVLKSKKIGARRLIREADLREFLGLSSDGDD